MAKLDLTFSDIYNQVSDFLGLGTSPSGSTLTKVQNIVYRAYRQFLFPVHPITGRKHQWSFLRKSFTLLTASGTWKYQLPLDFGEMLGTPHYGDEEVYPQLVKVSPDMILEYRASTISTTFPEVYAIVPVSTSAGLGTTWELWLYPEPDGVYPITFSYQVSPEKPSATTDVVLGGPLAGEVILEMALAEAELQEENVVGNHAQRAATLLAQLILADITSAPDFLGTLGGAMFGPRLGSKRYGTDSVYSADK